MWRLTLILQKSAEAREERLLWGEGGKPQLSSYSAF